ncbi:MAG TPA: 2OG-Fe(II) oxygenase [Ferrovibrio sp.]|uniref:2OG-Fe(II) oxygenase n=1 Tax=Ferrovibrio sp. TaxID=1917215 RepID=UPI002ED3DDCD
MPQPSAIRRHFLGSLQAATAPKEPYPHWLLDGVLPLETAAAVVDLPLTPAQIGETFGKRDSHNESRAFFAGALLNEQPVCRNLAAGFQDPETVAALEQATGAGLAGNYLRIEYCQDTRGFWLEPHTDIGAKKFTMLIYLSTAPGAAGWGTDLYDKDKRRVGRAPAAFNQGLIFIPGDNTWHGFEPRPIDGVRRSLIVNYVIPDWRARHELAFPDQPVRAAG